MKTVICLGLFAVLFVAACSSGSGSKNSSSPLGSYDNLKINQSAGNFVVTGSTVEFSAILEDVMGNTLDSSNTSWTISPIEAGSFSVKQSSVTLFTVTTVAKMQATITATAGGKISSSTIYINYKPNAIKLITSESSMIVGSPLNGSTSMTTEVLADGMPYVPSPVITWTVMPAGAADVTSFGSTAKVTALSAGNAMITASFTLAPPYGTGVTVSSSVVVTIRPQKLILYNDSYDPSDTWYINSGSVTITRISSGGGVSGDMMRYLQFDFASMGARVAYKFTPDASTYGYTKIVFSARGTTAGQVVMFRTNTSPSSSSSLTPFWQEFERPILTTLDSVGQIFEISPISSTAAVYIDNIYLTN
ncbi:MAG: hypothetical protein FWH43_03490 [Endomicrobia bacterium]|nr:hypothetical protein [Endomicrobiia bacterium]